MSLLSRALAHITHSRSVNTDQAWVERARVIHEQTQLTTRLIEANRAAATGARTPTRDQASTDAQEGLEKVAGNPKTSATSGTTDDQTEGAHNSAAYAQMLCNCKKLQVILDFCSHWQQIQRSRSKRPTRDCMGPLAIPPGIVGGADSAARRAMKFFAK